MELIELNEAFAAQVLSVTREWGFTERDFDRLNVNGSGISLGHPIGATGLAQIVEAVTQLRGSAGRRQVPDARIALTQNAGGWHGSDNVASVVHIFGRRI